MRNVEIDELADLMGATWLRIEPADVYDPAIVGYTDTSLVYDRDLVIAQAVEHEGMDYETAVEWHEFNTFCAYMGEHTPVFLKRFSFLIHDVANEVRGEPAQPAEELAPLVAVETDDTVVGVPV
jgi:hypothetical protein